MSGPDAQEAFLKTLDLKLSRAAAYQATVPVFGKGVIFDAPPEKLKTQLKIQVDALRYQNMKNYSTVISQEVEDWVAGWGDEGLEAFQETKHVHIESEIAPKEWWYPYSEYAGGDSPPHGA
jgi:hypothetical protein